jgi:hypothetical protein
MLRGVAVRHRVRIGSSFLCRDQEGEVRNAFMLVVPDGTLVGDDEKDLPTMWGRTASTLVATTMA